MSKKSGKKPRCSNCDSKDLGSFLCRNCYENFYIFDTDEALTQFNNELETLFPELQQVYNAATLQEVEEMADELDLKLSARLTPYQQNRFFIVNEKVKQARLALIRNQNASLFASNIMGIALFSVALISSLVSAFKLPGLLAALIPISAIIYFNNFVFCKKCIKFVFKKHSLLRKTILEERYGTHTEHQEVRTSVQNYDSRGHISGYSSASTYIPHHVEHVDEKAEYVYACNYCGHIWGATRTKRFNLN